MARRKTDSTIKILYHQVKPDIYKEGRKVRAGLDCPDGIAAAWVVLRKYPTATLVGCAYGSELPTVDNDDLLIIVDFSFELDVINQWRDRGCKIILIDHHKTLVDKVHEHIMKVLKRMLGVYLQSYRKQQSLIAQQNTSLLDAIHSESKTKLAAQNQPVLKDFLAFIKLTNFWKDIKNTVTWQRRNPRLYEILTTKYIDSEGREFHSWVNYIETNNLPVEPTEDHPYFSNPDTLFLDDLRFAFIVETFISKFCNATDVKRLFRYSSDGNLNFDIAKCGAVLTWEYFFPDEPVPAFLLYVQDRDLWTWQQPKSKEINEAFSHIRFGTTRNQILVEMDRFYGMSQDDLIYHFETLGDMLLAPKRERSEIIAKRAHWVEAWGYKFLAVPINPRDPERPEVYQIATDAYYYNDVMELLYTAHHDSPFVCTYTELPDNQGYKLSLRSRQQYEGFDVSALARTLGGGGHFFGAGLRLDSLPWMKESVLC
jgi:hypothetical protein